MGLDLSFQVEFATADHSPVKISEARLWWQNGVVPAYHLIVERLLCQPSFACIVGGKRKPVVQLSKRGNLCLCLWRKIHQA